MAACGHVSASSHSLRFILILKLYSSFITLRPGITSEEVGVTPVIFMWYHFKIIICRNFDIQNRNAEIGLENQHDSAKIGMIGISVNGTIQSPRTPHGKVTKT